MRWAALLRGINLGKRQIVKADLIGAAQDAGYGDPRTLLASGNLVFTADATAEDIERDLHAAILARTGISSDVHARTAAQIEAVLAANPFPEVARERPSQLLVVFHREPVPTASLDRIAAEFDGPERLAAVGRELFIDYPEGIGRSTLDAWIAKHKPGLPSGTGRNVNTVTKLAALLRS